MSNALVKNTDITNQHESVMVQEVLKGLKLPSESIPKEGVFIDLTFGRGGHTCAILNRLSQNGRVFAMDKDPEAIPFAKDLEQKDPRFKFKAQTFSELYEFCKSFDIIGKVDGIVMDLGVSSPQLDEGHRGFSFQINGPLDMRMDPSKGESAADWINTAEESEIQWVFKNYGEERFYKRIAHAIIEARSQNRITTTEELADIVTRANPAWEKHKHPATRCFQAIRIFINHELEELSLCLEQTIPVLAPHGRLVVISFHSLEDRKVKQFIQKNERDQSPRDLPILANAFQPILRSISKKIKPSDQEISKNRRSRSAVLRVAEKVGEAK